MILLFCLVSCTAFGSCGRKDVSSDPKYWGGYVPGATYRLQADAQYFEDHDGSGVTRVGVAHGSHVTLIPKGVRVQLDRIERKEHIEAGELVYFMGHFVDGPFAGRKIDLGGISLTTENGPQRDPKMLEIVP